MNAKNALVIILALALMGGGLNLIADALVGDGAEAQPSVQTIILNRQMLADL